MDEAGEFPRRFGSDVAHDPAFQRLAIPFFRTRRAPWRVGRNRFHVAVPAALKQRQLDQRQDRHFGNRAGEAHQLSQKLQDRLSRFILRVCGNAEPFCFAKQNIVACADIDLARAQAQAAIFEA